MRTIALASLLMAFAASSQAATLDDAATLDAFTQQSEKLHDRLEQINTASWPLLVEGAELCQVGTVFRTGIDGANFPDDVPGRAEGTYAISVAEGSPADTAGIRRDDRIIKINGKATNRRFGSLSEEDLDAMLTADSAQAMEFELQRGGQPLTVQVVPVEVCNLTVQYMPGQLSISPSQGNTIIVTDMLFTVADEAWERRAFIAPDMAYAMSATRSRNDIIRKAADFGGGFLGNLAGVQRLATAVNLGTRLSLNKDQALKADRVSLFLLARTGVNVDLVPGFWASVYDYPQSSAWNETYFGLRPTLAERSDVFVSTLEEIKQLQADGQPLIPANS